MERPWLGAIEIAWLSQRPNADLPHRLGCVLEIHRHPSTQSHRFAQSTRTHTCRSMPSLRVSRHSHQPWIPAGTCSGRARDRDPGDAFFCSNRYAKLGCGRTFPVYWYGVIPSATLRTNQLLAQIEAMVSARSVQAALNGLRFPISLRGAHRWLASWKQSTSSIRSRLGLLADPPGKVDGFSDPLSLHHLHAAFPGEACGIAAYQNTFQRPIIPPPSGNPV